MMSEWLQYQREWNQEWRNAFTLLLLSNALDLQRCRGIPSLIRFSMSNRLASTFFFGDLRFNRRRFLKVSWKLLPEVFSSRCGGEDGTGRTRVGQVRLRFWRWRAGASSTEQVGWWWRSGRLLVLTLKCGRREWLCEGPSSSPSTACCLFWKWIICSTRLIRLKGDLAISFSLLLLSCELSCGQWSPRRKWTVAQGLQPKACDSRKRGEWGLKGVRAVLAASRAMEDSPTSYLCADIQILSTGEERRRSGAQLDLGVDEVANLADVRHQFLRGVCEWGRTKDWVIDCLNLHLLHQRPRHHALLAAPMPMPHLLHQFRRRLPTHVELARLLQHQTVPLPLQIVRVRPPQLIPTARQAKLLRPRIHRPPPPQSLPGDGRGDAVEGEVEKGRGDETLVRAHPPVETDPLGHVCQFGDALLVGTDVVLVELHADLAQVLLGRGHVQNGTHQRPVAMHSVKLLAIYWGDEV